MGNDEIISHALIAINKKLNAFHIHNYIDNYIDNYVHNYAHNYAHKLTYIIKQDQRQRTRGRPEAEILRPKFSKK